jgi:multiple sugar transport system ATP-binding protein
MASVQLESVSMSYKNGVAAVIDTSFVVEDGEFVVLVGPSGCGKSTILRMIAGLEEITSGTIRIDGEVVNDRAPRDRDVAMVFQNYALYPHMSVFDNMATSLRVRRRPHEEIESAVREAAEILELGELLERRPAALSGGQRQRVALGRAMVRHPKAFLFDEPLSNLDAKMRVEMRAQITDLHRRLGATMIYVTHDQTEAMTMGQRIVVLDRGRVQQIAPPMQLYESPANRFVAGFIGSPAMNLFPARIDLQNAPRLLVGETFAGIDGTLTEELERLAGRKVVLGIRPEHLHMQRPPNVAVAWLEAEVSMVEPLGNETIFHSKAGGHAVVMRAPGGATLQPGASVRMSVDLSRAHWFDAETGKTLLA